MPEWTQHQAMAELDPFFEVFDEICRGGLSRYQTMYAPEIRIEHDGRTAANCIYSHMAALADQKLTSLPGVVYLNIRGLKVWVLGERAAVRFKKMDEDGRWQNHTSQQQRDFDAQLSLPGLPHPPLNLVTGYYPNATGTEVERVQVAKPAGRGVDWCAAIIPTSDQIVGQPRWTDITRQGRFG